MSEFLGTGTRVVIAITGVVSVFAAVVGAGITFFVTNASLGSQVAINNTRINSLEATVSQLVETNTTTKAQDVSRNGRITALETSSTLNGERVAALRTDVVRLLSDLREIETQFCASDTVRNLIHANDLRTVSLLWQKIYGVPYPTNNAYYPQVCNKATQSAPVSEK